MKPTRVLMEVQSIFDLNADDMERICELGGADIPASRFTPIADAAMDQSTGDTGVTEWCSEPQAIQFLNGFIAQCRGPADKPPPVETRLTNNLIFRKVKIALGLEAEDILQMLADVELVLSKHELSALFRKSDNKHYRECSDELLEAFLNAVRINHYG